MPNKEKFTQYFKSGAKTKGDKYYVGLELEHFVVDKEGRCVPYFNGVENILNEIKDSFNEVIYSKGYIIGLISDDYTITLEPGSQIEISISRKDRIEDIEKIYFDFLNVITPPLDKRGYRLLTQGYSPQKAEEIELIPKDRYIFMDRYFEKTGPYGRYMMRGTASTQVCVDYYDEEDFSKKYYVAYSLKPVLSLLTANSPCFQGEKNDDKLLRTHIWENVDKDRVIVDKEMNFSKYADFVLNCPLIVKGEEYTEEKIKDVYKDITQEEIEHCLSMVFPEVRLKKYIEIRFADSLPVEYALSYATLIKGLFKDITKIYNYVIENKDYEVEKIFEIAKENSEKDEIKYLEKLENRYGQF